MNPTPDRRRRSEIQTLLNDAFDRVQTQPADVLRDVSEVVDETAQWTHSDAYLWCLLLTTRALRYLDQLDDAAAIAERALHVSHDELSAHLHLEAGMSLNQADRPRAAEPHLRAALHDYRRRGESSGVSWAATSLAESLCATGRPAAALELIQEALDAAGADTQARVRALKQHAVIARQLGDMAHALALIEEVLAGLEPGHARANALLELAHIRSYFQDYRGAESALLEADTEYRTHRDTLGSANTQRALAVNDLLLGRTASGLRHLDRAEALYADLGNRSGRGYVLCERSTVLLAGGDAQRADADADTAIQLFTDNDDAFGLSRAHRAKARAATHRGDHGGAAEALRTAAEIAERSGSPLAQAAVVLMRADADADAAARLQAAREAADCYDQLQLPLGIAHAEAYAAAAAAHLGRHPEAAVYAAAAGAQLYQARSQVADPDRRADHHVSSRDVTDTVLAVCADIGTEQAFTVATDVLIDDFPLGLREVMDSGELSAAAAAVLGRIGRVRAGSSGTIALDDETPLLRQLAVALATLTPGHHPARLSMSDLRGRYRDAAVVIVGAPTAGPQLPVAWSLPQQPIGFQLRPLLPEHVAAADALNAVAPGDPGVRCLWHPDQTGWQTTLSPVLIPEPVQDWLTDTSQPREVVIAVAPVLARLPLEALMIGEVPLGVCAAVRRLPVPTTARREARIDKTTAYFDPALNWTAERAALGDPPPETADAAALRSQLGPHQLVVIGCHGRAATGLSGALIASDGTVVATAADLLSSTLHGSTVVFESCYSGRFVGPRAGEPFTLATAALLAGAHSVTAATFALPADEACTGAITAALLTELRAGVSAAEALRRARATYLGDPPTQLRLPGPDPEARMPGAAPWAWAGYAAYG